MFFLMDDWEYHGDTMGQNWDERVWKFLETADLGVLDIFGQPHVFFLKPGESELIHIYRAELMDVNFVSLSW